MATDHVDHIGDRLDHPERVPAELWHLIADDQQRVKRILEFPVSGRVIDIGCSDGAITRRIAEKWGVQAIGMDTRETAYRPLLKWDIRESLEVGAVVPFLGDIGGVTWGNWDTVYACEVFEHLTDVDAHRALKNICAVLKSGGDLIVTVPNRHPHDLYEVGCRARWAWPDHRSSWDATKLIRFLWQHFERFWWVSVYDNERVDDGIWLIVRATSRRK